MGTKVEWSIALRWYAWALGFYIRRHGQAVYFGPIQILRWRTDFPSHSEQLADEIDWLTEELRQANDEIITRGVEIRELMTELGRPVEQIRQFPTVNPSAQ